MRTLNGHKLLVDEDCPMCRLYGKGFEKVGWVDKETFNPYQTFIHSGVSNLDMERARNEIALVDTQTNTVRYGIDALAHIITNRFPASGNLLKSRPVDFFLRKLYRFISFNRKVIAPGKPKDNVRVCAPDMNIRYRIAYILFVVLCSSLVLYGFSQPINDFMGWKNYLGREFLICIGQIVWQMIFLKNLLKGKFLEYIGNMMTVSMIGTLLLLPMLLVKGLAPLFLLVYFIGVVSFMLLEHIRRSKILQIGYYPTISWLVYRIVVLGLIIFLN